MSKIPQIAIVGRPNVGKSKLFNKLIKKNKAIVENFSGLTRDRNYGRMEVDDGHYLLIDTGGVEFDEAEQIECSIREQVELAAAESDLIIFVVDGSAGILPSDMELNRFLRKTNKPLILAVNKIDHPNREHLTDEFYRLGIPEVIPISAEHSHGLGELKEALQSHLQTNITPFVNTDIAIAIVGRPNVGKSSILNRLLSREQNIVSPVSGTTRDSIDTYISFHQQTLRIIDTAGIRHKRKIKEDLERLCVIKSLRSINECDIAIIVIDATEGITDQDLKIFSYAQDQGKGIILAVNKWDLILEKDAKNTDLFLLNLRDKIPFARLTPIVLISALENLRVHKLLRYALTLYQEYCKRVDTSDFNEKLQQIMAKHQPQFNTAHQKQIKVYYGTQIAVKPPTFLFFNNYKGAIHFSYKRYLTNQIRKHFGFTSVPIKLIFKPKKQLAETTT